jgi:anti-sigma B factor antagonist
VSIDIKQQDDSMTELVIQDEMTIYTVLEQKNSLLPYLEADKKLQLDLYEVSDIDSAGIQLLILMKQQAQKLNNQFSLVHHSSAVIEVLELLDLVSFFGDPVVLSANGDS